MTKQEKAAAKRSRKVQDTILSHPSRSPLAMKFKAAVLAQQVKA